MENVPVPTVRTDFNTTQFLASAGLNAPIGGDMFLCGDPTSGPSAMPNICTATATTANASAASSAAATTGLVVFTSTSGRAELNGLIAIICGVIVYSMVRL